ncbi:Ninein [Frankliniella fusca]|uniref:Ninein n=1 Tax=Frankliniella fusca TaxID=407009 RepID=A0AAE1GTP9_9NEOP|nr:Ninein [Frankliniella fusca]
MDTFEADPYKQQLYALFESFDTNHVGSLDRKGLQQLCEQLPLDQNQSLDLISAVLCDSSTRITFPQFWDGLLAHLGGGWSSSCVQGSSCVEKPIHHEIADERGESPEREVSPKLVLGQKKYGRRSRPESSELEFDSNTCDNPETSETSLNEGSLASNGNEVCGTHSIGCFSKKRRANDTEESQTTVSPIPPQYVPTMNGFQGSLCQAEECLKQAWQQFGKNGFVTLIELEQVFECIGIDKPSSEAMQQLFEQLDANRDGKVSFDDFLILFRSGVPSASVTSTSSQGSWGFGLNSSTLSGGASLNLIEISGSGVASADTIIELWENAGVLNPSSLWRDLNFDESLRSFNISLVASALEEEILRQGKTASVPDNPALPVATGPSVFTNNLMLAALTLRQTEVRWIRSSLEQMSCERDKLKNDLAEANYRASLLAQEIDDHHFKLEKVNQNQFKLLELKHSEAIRDLTARFSAERDQLSQQNNRLEQKVATLLQTESKLSSEIAALKTENETLEQESRVLSEHVAECEEAKNQMSKELQEIENLQQRLAELQANQDQDRIEHLVEQISKLRSENSTLRDRNDELAVELEVLTARLSNMRVKRQATSSVDGSLKRRGNSPLGIEPADDSGDEESPRVGKVRRCSQKGEVSLDNVHIEGLQIHTLGTAESGLETDVDSTGNLDVASITQNALHLESEKWLNQISGSSSLLGSQDNLMNISSCDLGCPSKENIDVARLIERIKELEKVLQLQTNNVVGTQDVKQSDLYDLKDAETESVLANKLDTSPSSFQVDHVADEHIMESQSGNGQEVEQLQQHCKDLETQLENVKVQIVKILSEKRACSQENCILKKRIFELRNQLPDTGLNFLLSVVNSSNDVGETSAEQDSNYNPQLNQQTVESSGSNDTAVSEFAESESIFSLKEKINTLQELHKSEVSALRNQCSDLEKSLSMMRDEYERCEDYWAGKLDEERQLAEQEQRITDEKFSELMSKIREYEDLFADDHMRRTCKPLDGRLETIEEQDALEKQVMELEEELEDVRSQAQVKLSEKDSEIQKLREQLQHHLEMSLSSSCCADRAVQVSDLETRSWGSDRTFIVKPRILKNEEALQQVNGKIPGPVLSSTSSSSSSCGSAGLSVEGGNIVLGAVRHHQPHARHRRMRHHPQYAALNCLDPEDELQAVGLRLREQEQTCIRLQRALRSQQQQTQALLQHSWDRHKQEVADLQIILQCTQEKLEQQVEISREQMNRLTRSDILVKELYVENAHLLASIQTLEERCLLLLQQQVSISSAENCSSV